MTVDKIFAIITILIFFLTQLKTMIELYRNSRTTKQIHEIVAKKDDGNGIG